MRVLHHLTCLIALLLPCAPVVCAEASVVANAQAIAPPQPFAIPPGFERQALDPIGGEIARPAGWFIDTQQTASGWSWVIAETDPRNGKPYLTGQRIQLVMGIEDNSGLTRAAFVAGFAEQKKREALEVFEDCPVVDDGDFFRRCLDVRERIDFGGITQEFRVLYSLMWGKQLDWVVTSTFGTPMGDLERVRTQADAMAKFRLFDGDIDKLARNAGHVSTIVGAATDPVGPIFNPVDEGINEADPDAALKDAVGRGFTYRDLVRTDAKFVSAKPRAGGLPPVAYAHDGTRLYGDARVAYVSTTEGRAAAVHVLSASDSRLEATLLAAARAWRFEPGTYDGKPVDILAAQDFHFEPDPEPEPPPDLEPEPEPQPQPQPQAEAAAQ